MHDMLFKILDSKIHKNTKTGKMLEGLYMTVFTILGYISCHEFIISGDLMN